MKKVIFLTLLALGVGFSFSGNVFGEEEGVTDTEIVIGSHQDLSGPAAAWGSEVKTGMEMKAREINEAGGIYGRKIRLVIEDSAYDPKKAIMVTNKMITRDKVFAFVGNFGTPTAGATKPIISKKKIPQMWPMSSASLFFEPYDRYSFGGAAPYYDQARCVAKYFVKTKGYQRIGIMYQDDEMGAIMLKGVKDQLDMYKMELTAAESYKRGTTEFSSQIAKLRKADVQVVVLATVMRETVAALKEAKKVGWQVDMCGMIPAFTRYVPELCLKAGFSPDGFYCTGQTPHIYADSPLPTVREWWKRFVASLNTEPEQTHVGGYLGILYFEIAAKRAGRDLTREKFIDALETFRDEPDPIFGGPGLTFTSSDHQGNSRVFMSQVKDGKFVLISDFIDFRKYFPNIRKP